MSLPTVAELVAWREDPKSATPTDVCRMIDLIANLHAEAREDEQRLLRRIEAMKNDGHAALLAGIADMSTETAYGYRSPRLDYITQEEQAAFDYALAILRGNDPNARG